jgi:hypothetical protein
VAFYKSAIITFSIDFPIVSVTGRTATSVTFSWNAVEFASSYQYTTDGGLTKREAVSGQVITKQSNGDDLVSGDTYNFQFKSYDDYSDFYSDWSPITEVLMSTDIIPTVNTLMPIPRDKGFILRAFVYDDGESISGCEGWFVIDGEETIHITGLHTNDYFEVFAFVDDIVDHTVKAALENLAGTTYGDLIHLRKDAILKLEVFSAI